MINAGLVLEGGGMKGIYTAGVLDYFLEKELEFASVYGVSAGACQMVSFLSKQKGRGRDVMLDYLDEKMYMGARSFLLSGDIFNVHLNYELIPNYLYPLDNETLNSYRGKAYAVATNIETGEAEYLDISDEKHRTDYVRASSSLPLLSHRVKIGKSYYLDGGIADSIPIHKSIFDGNAKNVVILTKPVGYRKKKEKTASLFNIRYHKYPQMVAKMKRRHIDYNRVLDFLEAEEKAGRCFIIRPRYDSSISRLEKDRDKLEALYKQGYLEAKDCFSALMDYLNA